MTKTRDTSSITISREKYNELMHIKTTYEVEKTRLQNQIEELKLEACYVKNQIETETVCLL